MPIIHHDISNEIPIHLQRMQYLAFCSLLGKYSCFDSPSPSCGNIRTKYLAKPSICRSLLFFKYSKHYSYWGPHVHTLSKWCLPHFPRVWIGHCLLGSDMRTHSYIWRRFWFQRTSCMLAICTSKEEDY
jgi:hypothetical protein